MTEDLYERMIDELEMLAPAVQQFFQSQICFLRAAKQLKASMMVAVGASAFTTKTAEPQFRPDAFANMIIRDAARKYLEVFGKPRSAAEIAGALVNGGLKHSSRDFTATVRETLRRDETFIRVENGEFGLASWTWLTVWEGKDKAPRKPTTKDLILQAMATQPDAVWKPAKVADALNANLNTIQSLMSFMGKSDEIKKAKGGYRLKPPLDSEQDGIAGELKRTS